MAKREILAGATSQTVDVFIQDSSSTTGQGLAGLVYNSAGLTCYYRKGATGSSTQLSLATQTVGGAYSSGGFVQIDATNMKGVYRLDLANAMVDTTGMLTVVLQGATNMAPCVLEIEVVAVDKFNATSMGIARLDAAVTSRMATYTQPTGFLAATFPSGTVANTTNITAGTITTVSGNVTGSVGSIATGGIVAGSFAAGAIDAAAIAADAIGASELAADAVAEIQTGLATSAALSTAQADLDDIQTRIPAALVSGRMDSSVGAMAANVVTASAIAADAIGASELAADAVSEIQSGLATSAALSTAQADLDDIQTRLPAALVGGRMDANLGAVNNSTVGVAGFERATTSITRGTVTTGATTTSIPTSSLTPAASVTDQFKGLILKFDSDTTTAALRGQGTDITASTAGGTLTVTALTTAPASGDTFTIQ